MVRTLNIMSAPFHPVFQSIICSAGEAIEPSLKASVKILGDGDRPIPTI